MLPAVLLRLDILIVSTIHSAGGHESRVCIMSLSYILYDITSVTFCPAIHEIGLQGMFDADEERSRGGRVRGGRVVCALPHTGGRIYRYSVF